MYSYFKKNFKLFSLINRIFIKILNITKLFSFFLKKNLHYIKTLLMFVT